MSSRPKNDATNHLKSHNARATYIYHNLQCQGFSLWPQSPMSRILGVKKAVVKLKKSSARKFYISRLSFRGGAAVKKVSRGSSEADKRQPMRLSCHLHPGLHGRIHIYHCIFQYGTTAWESSTHHIQWPLPIMKTHHLKVYDNPI